MNKIVFLHSEDGDWEGMYINGRLVIQGHSVDGFQAMEAVATELNLEVTSVEKSMEWFEKNSWSCPDVLD